MATANTPPGKKHLRVALRQGSKITEDRTLKKRAPLTIGQDAKNTFVVPVSDLPASFTILELVNDQYSLVFKRGMEGKVSVGTESEITLEQAISSGKAKPRGDTFVLPLTDASKGRVKLGEVSLLFQFVNAPVEPPKAELPPDVRGSAFSQIDRFFLTVLSISLLVHFSGGAYCAVHPKIEEGEVALEDLPDRFAKAIMPQVKPPPEKKPEVADKGNDKKDDKKDDKKAEAKADKPATSNKPTDAVKAAVASKGLLKILGANTGGSGAFEDLLGGANSGAGSVADALSGASGVGVATSDTLGNNGIKGGSGAGNAASIGDLGTNGGGKVALGEKAEVAVKGRLQDSAPEVESGEVDREKLAAFVRQRKASIQGCYEKELKRNPSLKGKVVVRFNITTSGGTSDIDLEENTLGNEAVGACIKTLIRGWRFPFKPGSEVPVAYPFVFSPAS
jgi:outer membrane biosynthesis protein TonB